MKNNKLINFLMIIVIILLLVLLSFKTNYINNNIFNKTEGFLNHRYKEFLIDKTDKEIDNLINENFENTPAITTKFNLDDAIYKKLGIIDDNNCYNPTFKLCNRKTDMTGYSIFTPVQNGCSYPGEGEISGFETALAQADKYLNLLPGDDITNDNGMEFERKMLCGGKPNVRQGFALFGLCNKNKLTDRCKALYNQKESIADMNKGVEVSDLETGIDNMKVIYSSCFPDETPLVCETETTQQATTTTLANLE